MLSRQQPARLVGGHQAPPVFVERVRRLSRTCKTFRLRHGYLQTGFLRCQSKNAGTEDPVQCTWGGGVSADFGRVR